MARRELRFSNGPRGPDAEKFLLTGPGRGQGTARGTRQVGAQCRPGGGAWALHEGLCGGRWLDCSVQTTEGLGEPHGVSPRGP